MNFQDAVKSIKWFYAKTYENNPHEYTMLEWANEETVQVLREFAKLIQTTGTVEERGFKKTYFYSDGVYRYWIGGRWDCITMIYRTFADDSRRHAIASYRQSKNFKWTLGGMSLAEVENQMRSCDDSVTNKAEKVELTQKQAANNTVRLNDIWLHKYMEPSHRQILKFHSSSDFVLLSNIIATYTQN